MVCSFTAYTKLDSPHCLFYNSLRVLFGDRAPFSHLEVSFSAPPSVSLAKKPELGGAVISIRTESQYLEFSMAASV
jgi:hypothetical protein